MASRTGHATYENSSVRTEGQSAGSMVANRAMASRVPLLTLLIAVTCLSQFYRVSNSVIAPELVRDLDLSARQLGWAGSAFFFATWAPRGLTSSMYMPAVLCPPEKARVVRQVGVKQALPLDQPHDVATAITAQIRTKLVFITLRFIRLSGFGQPRTRCSAASARLCWS